MAGGSRIYRFSLRRWFCFVGIIAFCSWMLSSVYWPYAILLMVVVDVGVAVYSLITARSRNVLFFGTSACLLFGALVFTDWGLSSRIGIVNVAWTWLAVGCVAQLAALTSGLLIDMDVQDR